MATTAAALRSPALQPAPFSAARWRRSGPIITAALCRAVYYGGDAVQYCLSRFKSYDPYSGTYLGYDGYRHPCP